MTIFKAGYYIDEFNKQLERIVDKSILSSLFENKLFFEISNLPDYINDDNINQNKGVYPKYLPIFNL